MKTAIDVIPAQRALKRGNIKSAFILKDEDSGKWVMRFFLKGDDARIILLKGVKTHFRQFSSLPPALRVAKAIGFERVEIDTL